MAIKVGPMNRPRKPKAMKPPKTPRMVSDIGILTPKPMSQGLMKLSIHADEHAPDDHEHAPDLLILREEPPGRSTPDQNEQRSADLADRKQQGDKALRRSVAGVQLTWSREA
jgi:hypothetical protein